MLIRVNPKPRIPDAEDEMRDLLNEWDRERDPPSYDEVGDYPDPPEDRYDIDY